MRIPLAAIFLLGTSLMMGAERPEFVGYLSDHNGRLFIVYDGSAKESSVWMKLGQTWHGLTPTAFDPKDEMLTVRAGPAEWRLSLRDPKVAGLSSVILVGPGTIRSEDGTVSYGPETKLRLRNNLISSPTGVMVTDRDQEIISGDLVIERPNGTVVKVTNGVVRVNGNQTSITADSIESTTPGPASPRR
jgi:hypothetical protein